MEYHVSKTGSDISSGLAKSPFKTISKAARIAKSGDTVIVHEGTYREWVKPANGGHNKLERITYKAAENEKVIIKGSEVVENWENVEGSVWKTTVDNKIFGEYNPFDQKVTGDWLIYPVNWEIHYGDLYVNGKSFFEAMSDDNLYNPQPRTKEYIAKGEVLPAGGAFVYVKDQIGSTYVWKADVTDEQTVIYANFHELNPNEQLTEISVRKSCFYPDVPFLNYITVSGFEMAHAATTFAPPTANQVGLIGPHWSKGWIIENNIIHDSKCAGISLGKDGMTGDNESYKYKQKPGYLFQKEIAFKSLHLGWNKESVGSHIVRNNVVYDCGENGIMGNMGACFSEIYGNEVYNIAAKHEFFGWELAAIKFHAPIDAKIYNNCLHDSSQGIWIDWEGQGVKISNNLLYKNGIDLNIEVCHGPMIIDHNISLSNVSFDNRSEGLALINNIFCGTVKRSSVMDRSVLYHLPHSTQMLGCAFIYGGDDRIYNNIYIRYNKTMGKNTILGNETYNGSPTSFDEYIECIKNCKANDNGRYQQVKQPAYIESNVYLCGAAAFDKETNHYVNEEFDPQVKPIKEDDGIYLEITVNQEMLNINTKIHSTNTLGKVCIADTIFDDPNGDEIVLDKDYFGNAHGENPTVGAIQNLKLGYNKIKVWG